MTATTAQPSASPSIFEAPDRLLKSDELSTIRGVDERTLGNWRSRGEGPPWLGRGRFIRFRAGDVVEWLRGGDRG
jgi:hypothetical protein